MKENRNNLFVSILSFLLSAAILVLIIFSWKEVFASDVETTLLTILFRINLSLTIVTESFFLLITFLAIRLTIFDWKFNKEFEDSLKIKTNYYLITIEPNENCTIQLKKECKTMKEVHEQLDTFRNGIQLMSPCSKYKVDNLDELTTTFTLTVEDGRKFVFKVEKKEK